MSRSPTPRWSARDDVPRIRGTGRRWLNWLVSQAECCIAISITLPGHAPARYVLTMVFRQAIAGQERRMRYFVWVTVALVNSSSAPQQLGNV